MKSITKLLSESIGQEHSCSTCKYFIFNHINKPHECSIANRVIAKHGKENLRNWLRNSEETNTCSLFKNNINESVTYGSKFKKFKDEVIKELNKIDSKKHALKHVDDVYQIYIERAYKKGITSKNVAEYIKDHWYSGEKKYGF